MSAYFKYLKYKKKYFMLKTQIAGGTATAKKFFIDSLFVDRPVTVPSNLQQVINMSDVDYMALINNDNGKHYTRMFDKVQQQNIKEQRKLLKKHKTFELFKINIMNDMANKIIPPTNVENTKELLDLIFDLIQTKLLVYFPVDLDKYIDLTIKWYLNNLFGTPSSLNNMLLFQDLIIKYNKISSNKTVINVVERFKQFMEKVNLNQFDSLQDFTKTMNSQIVTDIINHIDKHNAEQEEKKHKNKTRALNLEQYKTKPIYESNTVTIYHPTNENESKYHGQNTKWCTSGCKDNQFNQYNKSGPLYVIHKTNGLPTDKFQLHVVKQEFREANDEQTSVKMSDFFKDVLQDDFNAFVFMYNNIFLEPTDSSYVESRGGVLTIKTSTMYNTMHSNQIFRQFREHGLTYFEEQLGRNINILKNPQEEHFIGEQLSKITPSDIRQLYITSTIHILFTVLFDAIAPFLSSNLTRLSINNIDDKYVDGLTQTQLNNMFSGLTNLIILTLYNCYFKLDALNNLVNLKELYLYHYHLNLDNVLSKLTKLEILIMPDYTREIGASINRLINLRILDIRKSNESLEKSSLAKSLENNINLKELHINASYASIFFDDFKKLITKLTKIKKIRLHGDFIDEREYEIQSFLTDLDITDYEDIDENLYESSEDEEY